MKTIFFPAILLLTFLSNAQESQSQLYVKEILSKIESPSAEQIDLEKGNEHFTAFYFNDKLISLRTVETGELANSVTTDYYLRNDSLIAIDINKCFTSQEILDIDMYIAGHTDASGKTDWSDLPSDCMNLKVFCAEKRFIKTVSGTDVFGQPGEITAICSAEEQNVKRMIEILKPETVHSRP